MYLDLVVTRVFETFYGIFDAVASFLHYSFDGLASPPYLRVAGWVDEQFSANEQTIAITFDLMQMRTSILLEYTGF